MHNTKSKYNTIVIDDNIKINIENVKNIKIYNNNHIYLYKNNSYDINNDIDLIYEKIKELDILLNLLNLLLFFQN